MSDSSSKPNKLPKGATTESETNEILAAIDALVVMPPKSDSNDVEESQSSLLEESVAKPVEKAAEAITKKTVITEQPAFAVAAQEFVQSQTPTMEHEPEAPIDADDVAIESEEVLETRDEKKQAETKESGIRFTDLPLRDAVQDAVKQAGYETPTPIQAEIIPHMLKGRDVLAQSQTGTGKTAAFALPILSRIDVENRRPQVLVLAPTRELAIQVAKSFETYAVNLPKLKVATIYGGAGYEQQFRALRNGAQVVVGTPGRVIDHLKRESLDLHGIKCLVLDEADEMLNMGFLEDVEFVLEHTPESRQIALFSATLPEPIREISKRYLNEPARVTIKKKTITADLIRQRAVLVSPQDKFHVLTRFIETESTDGVIVFTKTKDSTVSVADQLTRQGFSAIALNGDMPQNVRERAIQQIKNGRFDILVATDVAARGLDLSRVSHVFNFDLPHDNESYIHRIGRTGRAGRKGEALIFLTGSQRYKLKHIERATRQTIEVVSPPPIELVNEKRIERFKQKLTTVIAESDLAMFDKIVGEYHTESGASMKSIASALAYLAQGGRRLLLTERTLQSTEGRGREKDGAAKKGKKANRKERVLGPVEEGMIRYRIAVGWRDGVKPGNIVGCIANEAGLEGKHIGPIKIQHSYSTVDLPEGMPKDVFDALKMAWVSGKQLRIREDGDGGWDDGERERRPRKRFDKNRKPGGKRFSKSNETNTNGRSPARSKSASGAKSGKGRKANTSNFGKSSFVKGSKGKNFKAKGGKGKFRKAKAK